MTTTPQQWDRLKRVFSEIVELPLVERAAAIGEACKDEPWLRSELLSLLEADDRASAIIGESALPAPGLTALPERIGPYRILGEIGRGGMGTVYLGEREEDFRQQVAIKVVRAGMDAEHILRRFALERQILATLDHPNIARLLDGGSTAEGLPYFVMEYVEGMPIDRYRSEHALSIEDRLRLFVPVCAAVHSAHQRLVVHRDIKPSNIIVTADGTPKLLDFGIAKLLDDTGGSQTLTELRAMTPEYASPEQAEGRGLTTASDIYSLGVVLYELLTGTKPYRVSTRSPVEIARVIATTDPPPPSMAASEPVTSRRLRGDLDTIVSMAMRKDPQRRYASAEALAGDIQRHLDGRPVLARRDTLRYRIGKSVRRNPAAFGSAAMLVLALIGGIAATSWQASQARAAQRRAEHRFGELRKLAGVLIFELDPIIAPLSGATSAREKIVSTGVQYLDSLAHEADDPTLQLDLARGYLAIADVQGNPYGSNLGQTDEATKNYGKALNILKDVVRLRPNDLTAADDLARAHAGLGDTAYQSDRLEHAEKLYGTAIAILEKNIARDPALERRRTFALCLGKHADVMGHTGNSNLGHPIEARAEHERALRLREQLAREHPTHEGVLRDLSETLTKIAYMENANGDYAAAAATNRRALDLIAKVAARNPTSANHQQDLSLAYIVTSLPMRQIGRYDEALPLVNKSLAIMQGLAARDPSSTLWQRNLSVIYNHLSQTLTEKGDHESAVEASAEAVRIAERLWNAEHVTDAGVDLIIAHRRATEPLLGLGRSGEALRHARRGIEITGLVQTSGNSRAEFERALLQARLGRALAQQQNLSGARQELERSRDALNRLHAAAPNDVQVTDELAGTLYHLALTYRAAGDPRARATARESASLFETLHGTKKLRSHSIPIAQSARGLGGENATTPASP